MVVSARFLLGCSNVVHSNLAVVMRTCEAVSVLEKCSISIVDRHSQVQLIISHVFAIPRNYILDRVKQERQYLFTNQAITTLTISHYSVVLLFYRRLELSRQYLLILPVPINVKPHRHQSSVIQSGQDTIDIGINAYDLRGTVLIVKNCRLFVGFLGECVHGFGRGVVCEALIS